MILSIINRIYMDKMLPELTLIKQMRKQFGLTQMELSLKSGVSQSLIAKIEAGNLIPTYNNAKRLFDTLESLHLETQLKAKDLMQAEKVVGIKPEASLKDAVRLMKKHAISQLPVMEEEKCVGEISENSIMEKLHSAKDAVDMDKVLVKEVMADSMPVIQLETPISVITPILEHRPAILVAKKGKIVGIITKQDLLAGLVAGKK